MATDTALHIAESIVDDGFDSLDAELAELLTEARRSNVTPLLLEVTSDHLAPRVVRERALGRVVIELSRTAPQPTLPMWVTSRLRRPVAA